MVEKVATCEVGEEALGVEGVGAVGVTLGGGRGCGERVVRDCHARGRVDVVGSTFDAFVVSDGDACSLTRCQIEMSFTRFFDEEKPCCGHAMMQREGINLKSAVFVYFGVLRGVEGNERDREQAVGAEEIEEWMEDVFCHGGRKDRKGGGASRETHRGNESCETEAMVAMEMTDEDMTYLLHADMGFSQSHLHPFAAVD